MIERTPAPNPSAGTGRRLGIAALIIAFILAIPLVAIGFTNEVAWSAFDFLAMGLLLSTIAVLFELGCRMSRSPAYRAASGLALAATLLLIWINLAVGFIGDEDDPANLLFVAVIGVAAAGSVLARFRSSGMARAMVAAAIVQAVAGVVAVTTDLFLALPSAFFVALWLGSAWLFNRAAHGSGRPVLSSDRQGR